MIDKATSKRTILYGARNIGFGYADLSKDIDLFLSSKKISPEYLLISFERFMDVYQRYKDEKKIIRDKQKFFKKVMHDIYMGVHEEFKESSKVKELILGDDVISLDDDIAIWKENKNERIRRIIFENYFSRTRT